MNLKSTIQKLKEKVCLKFLITTALFFNFFPFIFKLVNKQFFHFNETQVYVFCLRIMCLSFKFKI